VIRPAIAPGVEEQSNLSIIGVDARQVWTFVEIAAMARQRQIIGIVGTAVLFRDNMFDVVL
jgi:hypothetical protein